MDQVPPMTPTDIAFRSNQDKQIRKNKCTFILRIHLYPLLTGQMCTLNIFNVPASYRDNLDNFLTNEIKAKCLSGNGLGCVAFEPRALCTSVTVRKDGEDYVLTAQWHDMMERCELKMRAVLSLWGYYEGGMLRFIFRHDGYARVGEPFPPLTDLTVVDEPVHQNKCVGNLGDCCSVG